MQDYTYQELLEDGLTPEGIALLDNIVKKGNYSSKREALEALVTKGMPAEDLANFDLMIKEGGFPSRWKAAVFAFQLLAMVKSGTLEELLREEGVEL